MTPTLKHDGKLDIATGKDRNTRSWKNQQVSWSKLLAKLAVTHRTPETHAEYLAAKPQRQAEIKDIGGFVGGFLAGGRRKNGSVVHRQLVTLDADFASPDLWDRVQLLLGCAACVYSTHKHSPEAPRLRLVVPLDREVPADQYLPIARRIAGIIGINDFDPSGFRPTQLMYWPSTSKDGEYVFEYQDGPWLSAAEMLASYRDWRDSSEWPMSDREADIPRTAIKKQGDPLTKPGLVGAFCRTYDIHEAIAAFLPEVYEPTDQPDRYTYLQGSTAGGLVVYEDKFAYSHHGTDPTGGKLCNAFDLVRLHLFGLQDEDAPEDTPVNKLPSYQAMAEKAAQDTGVRKTLAEERMVQAASDFAGEAAEGGPWVDGEGDEGGDEEEVVEDDLQWVEQLDVDKKGNYTSSIQNVYLVLKNDPKLKDRIMLDEFENRLIAVKNLPWRKVTQQTRDFSDDDVDCLSHYLESKEVPFTQVPKALAKIRTENRFHPVRDYLNRLSWDGRERVDSLFIDFLGAEDSEYTRAVARLTMVAAVARVMEPGVKFDTVLTFIGREGIGKSTLVAKLAGKWFSDCLGDIHGKEGMESLRGVWFMEVAELSSFRKADQEAIKRFITSREDVYRPAYGKMTVRFPRQCVFVATTNKRDFLASGQGNRRFLPVDTHVTEPVKSIFGPDLSQGEIDQIWAEAVHLYKAGAPLTLPVHLYGEAEKARDAHTETDDRAGLIDRYLKTMLPEDWGEMNLEQRRDYMAGFGLKLPELHGVVPRTEVSAAEIWCELFNGSLKDMNGHSTKFIHDILRGKKAWFFEGRKRFSLYGMQKIYRLKTSPLSVIAECDRTQKERAQRSQQSQNL